MLDFTDVENAIINDLKPICIDNYLILNQLNLPKEVNLLIVYAQLQVFDEMILLRKDIYNLRIDRISSRMKDAILSRLDILGEYKPYLTDNTSDSIYKCAVLLYEKNNQIFNMLNYQYYKQCADRHGITFEFLYYFPLNFHYYIGTMETHEKYSSLLKTYPEWLP